MILKYEPSGGMDARSVTPPTGEVHVCLVVAKFVLAHPQPPRQTASKLAGGQQARTLQLGLSRSAPPAPGARRSSRSVRAPQPSDHVRRPASRVWKKIWRASTDT